MLFVYSVKYSHFWQPCGMQEDDDYTITKNGLPITELDLEFHEERYILSVTCFVDKWNYRQYFFETWSHWALFRWSTGA